MQEKSTDDLNRELMEQSDLGAYLSQNQHFFDDHTVAEHLAALYEQKSVTKAALARSAGMSEVYLHQVFSGRRKPSRDRLICLCIGLEASLEETQQLLRLAGYAPLYPRLRRDAMISFSLLHHMPLQILNDKLFAENEKTLF